MNVRRAKMCDIDKIKDLLLQVLTVHHNGRPDLFKSNCRKYNDDELAGIIADDTRPIFVSEDNGEVKGYAFCILKETKNDHVFYDAKTLYIDDLCVDENCRGQHVGKTIYEYVKTYAKEIGCYNVTLNVWSCNPSAQAFYESCGFVPQKTTMEMIL